MELITAENKTVVLASHFQGLSLNSPNDATVAPNGDIYFTDPSYGLYGMFYYGVGVYYECVDADLDVCNFKNLS